MSPRIGRNTRIAGVIGWPLGHTLSPAMHNAAYQAMGLEWVYLALPVRDESDLFRVFGCLKVLPFVGINVTMPYKRSALSLCDEVAMQAEMAGAVNTVHVVDGRLIGYNTDGRGLLEALRDEAGFDLAGKRVALLGAGGAAGAAMVAFLLGRAAEVTVVNRSVENAEEVVSRLAPHMRETEARVVPLSEEAESFVSAADLVVNATPVGMDPGDPSPIPDDWLRPGQVVFDMVYRKDPTELLRTARRAGARPIGGLPMLVAQAAIAVDIWSGGIAGAVPRDVMSKAAEDQMAQSSRERAET